MSNTETTGANASFLTIAAGARKYASAGFTEASLRWLAFNREVNGFGPAFIKVGRRLLIDEVVFVACLRKGQGKGVAA